jgi:hypothetical protein
MSITFLGNHPLVVTIFADTVESWAEINGATWLLLLAQRDHEPEDMEGRVDETTGEVTPIDQFALTSLLEQSLQRQYPRPPSLGENNTEAEKLCRSEGLILQAVNEKQRTFRRVGYWKGVTLASSFDMIEPAAITII